MRVRFIHALSVVCAIGTALFLTAASSAAMAQELSKRPVHLILPYPAGGSSDFLARLVADGVSKSLGQPVVVENRPGANGIIAMEAVANAEPNGHTLLFGVTSLIAMNPHILSMRIDPLRQFAPVAQLGVGEFILVAANNTPVSSIAELIEHAKANPERSFASSGAGSHAHIAMEMFRKMADVQFLHVPYKGGAPALTDLLGGHVSYLIDGAAATLPHIQQGRIKALGVTSAKRWPTLPDIPAISETLPGYDSIPWYGIFAPAATPQTTVAALNKLFVEALQTDELRTKMSANGFEVVTGTPDQFAELVRTDHQRYGQIIRELRLKAQ